jgi:hypothetical protein
MTDAEFERLDAEFERLLRSRRQAERRRVLAQLLARCRDCDRPDPEWYMLRRDLWLQAVPSGRGCLCLACLAKRLNRPLVAKVSASYPIDATTVASLGCDGKAKLSINRRPRLTANSSGTDRLPRGQVSRPRDARLLNLRMAATQSRTGLASPAVMSGHQGMAILLDRN